MSGLIRQHTLSDLDALDRRRVWENYLEVAKRLSEIRGSALGDGVLKRMDFQLQSWVEFQTAHGESLNYATPRDGAFIPNALLEMVQDDGFYELRVAWSIDVQLSNSSKFIVAWPVFDGKACYEGMDYLQQDQVVKCIAPVPGNPAVDPSDSGNLQAGDSLSNVHGDVTLGNSFNVVGLNGRSHLSIMIKSVGRFDVKKCTISVKRVLR